MLMWRMAGTATADAAAFAAAARPGSLATCMLPCEARRSVSVSAAAAAAACRLLSCQPSASFAEVPVPATPTQPPSTAATTAAEAAATVVRSGHATLGHAPPMRVAAAHGPHGSLLRPPMQRHAAPCSAAAAASALPGMYIRSALSGGAPRPPAPRIHTRTYASDDRSAAVSRLARASRHREQRAAAKPPAGQAAGTLVAPTGATVVPSETTASEAQVHQVLGHPALVVTRPIEWGTVVFGFEQANKYHVLDEQGNLVALIAEDQTGIGNEIGRQVLRTHRSFTATVLSADGTQVICRVRRPAYLITSTMYIEDGEGNTVGEVHRRWSAINRNYDLYLNKKQFASITGSFLAWEFELKDDEGRSLAFIDRNFMGFGKEIFTDAGQYAIHFGLPAAEAEKMVSNVEQAKASQAQASPPPVPPKPLGPEAATDDKALVIPTQAGSMIQVARRLHIDERMITLACAISIDYGAAACPRLFGVVVVVLGGGGGGGDDCFCWRRG